eukprot:5529843-Pyramimonas_sp.AAC.1
MRIAWHARGESLGLQFHQLARVWLAHWSKPVSRQGAGLMPKVILDPRWGGPRQCRPPSGPRRCSRRP